MPTTTKAQHRTKSPMGDRVWVYRRLGTSQLKDHQIYQLVSSHQARIKRRGGWGLLDNAEKTA